MSKMDTIVNVMLGLAALGVGVTMLRREFVPSATDTAVDRPVHVRDWERTKEVGILMGDSNAAVSIVTFADMECPYCARFDQTLRSVKAELGGEMNVLFVHYPLPNHRFALPGARAVECGAEQGRALQLIELLYDKQDSLGVVPWVTWAKRANVPDSTRFQLCMEDRVAPTRIARGRALGDSLGVRGTPTVIVNGWRLPSPPDHNRLMAVINDVRNGRKPSDE